MKALSLDLRQRILEAYQRGEASQRELARRFAVSRSSVERLLARFHATGSLAPTQQRHGPLPRVQADDFTRIEAYLAQQCDLTQQELADRFTAETGCRVSQRTMSRVLQRMDETRKKSP